MSWTQETIDTYTTDVVENGEAVNLMWSSLCLLTLLVSFYKFDRKKLWNYGGLFWSSITVAYILIVTSRVLVIVLHSVTNPYQQGLLSIGSSIAEFSFSIVNLALKSLHNLFLLKDNKTEKMWVAFNALQIPVNILIVLMQIYVGDHEDNIFWNNTFIWVMQLVNLCVFAFFYFHMKKDIEKASLSEETFLMLKTVMTRFVDFYFVYLIFSLFAFFGTIATIMDISGYMNNSVISLWNIWVSSLEPARFYVVLSALYIFQPHWYLICTKVERNLELTSNQKKPSKLLEANVLRTLSSTTNNFTHNTASPGLDMHSFSSAYQVNLTASNSSSSHSNCNNNNISNSNSDNNNSIDNNNNNNNINNNVNNNVNNNNNDNLNVICNNNCCNCLRSSSMKNTLNVISESTITNNSNYTYNNSQSISENSLPSLNCFVNLGGR